MTRANESGRRAAEPSGRRAAYDLVAHVLTQHSHAADELAERRATGALPSREAALAMELTLGALRHWVTLGHLLSAVARVDERRTPPMLRAIVWVGAYQLIWTDRIPAYAAVDDAVAAARERVGVRAARMVNAVLRNLGRAIVARGVVWQRGDARQVRVNWTQACAFERAVLPAVDDATALPNTAGTAVPQGAAETAAAHNAAAAGMRVARYRALVERFGAGAAEQVAWASQAPPATVLQRHMPRIDAATFQRRLRAEFGEAVEFAATAELAAAAEFAAGSESAPDAAFLPAGVGAGRSALLAEGFAYVQDPTAHAAALLLAPQPGERVLDLCAAPGGKTVTLALAMHDRGEIIAADSSAERLAKLAQLIERLGLRCVTPVLVSPEDASVVQGTDELAGGLALVRRVRAGERTPGGGAQREPHDAATRDPLGAAELMGFDAVLLDAPCTNTGVLARRPEARLTFSRRKLDALAAIQRRLLQQAAAQVRPGGRLVYSTCSLEPEENQEQMAAFLSKHADWRMAREQLTLPRWGPRAPDWRDGGYAALLVRGVSPERSK